MITLHSCPDARALGRAAGAHAASVLREADSDRLRVMLAAAPSQLETLTALAQSDGIDWSRIDFFHMDDYVGLAPDSPRGFANWLERHFLSLLGPHVSFSRMDISLSPEQAAHAYGKVLGDEPFDLSLCGLGINGHLAFNDPPADFSDPEPTRVVELAHASRKQQVDEGLFPRLDDVPTHAVTVTIPRLLNARVVICSVPGAEKRQAVRDTLDREPGPDYPGTALRSHPDAHLYVDAESGKT
ncbi:MAG: 6-phosphogluconolactonase [Propionibacteriaceae bacterium]